MSRAEHRAAAHRSDALDLEKAEQIIAADALAKAGAAALNLDSSRPDPLVAGVLALLAIHGELRALRFSLEASAAWRAAERAEGEL